MKKLFAIFAIITLIVASSIDIEAKSGGSSSFGGGSRSGGSSFSGSKSSSGWSSSSKPSTPSYSTPSKPSSPSTGWSSTPKPSTPSSPSSPSTGWSSSAGNTAAPKDSGKSSFSSSGSLFSSKPSTPSYTPKYTPPSSGYTPRYYNGTSYGRSYDSSGSPIIINQGPGLGYSMIDLWWKMELLDTLRDRGERDAVIREMRSNPEYAKWKEEAAKVSDENAELKKKLQDLEEENKTVKDIEKEDSSNIGLIILGAFLFVVVAIAIIYFKMH